MTEPPADFGANAWFIEDLLDLWQQDPAAVPPEWASYFAAGQPVVPVPAAPAAAEPVVAEPVVAIPAPPAPLLDSAQVEPVPPSTVDPAAAPAEPVMVAPEPATPAAPAEAPAAPVDSAPATPAAYPSSASSANPVSRLPSAGPNIATPLAPDTLGPFVPEAPPTILAAEPVSLTQVLIEPASRRRTESPQAYEAGLTANPADPTWRQLSLAGEPQRSRLRKAALRTAQNMEASLGVPTATSVRTVPMKLAIDLRRQMNQHLAHTRGGKVSFTHLIAYAMVQAIQAVPAMNSLYELVDGKPTLTTPAGINLGLAIDLNQPDGSRQLLVPVIRQADGLDFNQFIAAYDDIVRRAQRSQLTADDFAGITCTLTNPGSLGTNHSVPRLMPGQGLILGVGAINYAPGFQGASPGRLNEMGISKVMTLTSTYDHRIIQGAQSGEFLGRMEELLTGRHDFYQRLFADLRIPYAPLAWDTDIYANRAEEVSKPARVVALVDAYRSLGHLMADIDPLLYRLRSHPDLELLSHGLTIWDLDREFAVGTLGGRPNQLLTLREVLDTLRDAYCRTTGVEYMHISDPEQRQWIQQELETTQPVIDHDEHLRILDRLNEAELFETFLQTKFVGQKRFSLEGGESTIVLVDEICEQAADHQLDEVCIGMPHRGRLNVLANIVGKSYSQIFQEFDEHIEPGDIQGSGDVKYHLGAEGIFTAASGGTIRTSVAANPSHLETVDPVLEGIARAKQDRSTNELDFPVLPVLLHGDAAFSGQGVTYETFQMSQLRGYATGGTIHVVINNQIGFTTAPVESRSSTYCTDVAKAVQAPVFHVNGDDPDACVRVAKLAFAYRQRFAKDVVIDLVCYRRRGHNEGDDPSFTQPLMYDLITRKRSVRTLYTQALIGRGDISVEDAEAIARHFRERLEAVFTEVRELKTRTADDTYLRRPAYPDKPAQDGGTAISSATMAILAEAQTRFPEGFAVHPKVLPQLERRSERIKQGPVDWATGEFLALGSLLLEGIPVRIAGQDTRRGTFSQRFGAVIDRHTNWAYVPLKHLSQDQAPFDIYDSLLSEYAALGFEYGYSVAAPGALVCWEAQFGDFANTAQAVIDEFIVSGNAKWQQKSGVVLLLPHGYEGQGPDHSSARIERWLQLCSEGALAVCQPSTPASYFHLLRTHAKVNWHRPLVIATPKSMLRRPEAVSSIEDFTAGSWRHVLADPTTTDPGQVERIILCSGKIRWELTQTRSELGLQGRVAILPLERLYPLPGEHLAEELARYPRSAPVYYVQDEPANQGAWWFMEKHLPPAVGRADPTLDLHLTPVMRPAASAPAVGSHHDHDEAQRQLLRTALT